MDKDSKDVKVPLLSGSNASLNAGSGGNGATNGHSKDAAVSGVTYGGASILEIEDSYDPNATREDFAAAEKKRYSTALWWIHFYSTIAILAAIYGILAAHVPPITGHPWTECAPNRVWCSVVYHIWEVPAVGYNVFVACWGLLRVNRASLAVYDRLLSLLISVDLVFYVIDFLLLQNFVNDYAPLWEILLLTSVEIVLALGFTLGMWVRVVHVTPLLERTPMLGGVPRGNDGYYHPKNTAEVAAIIRDVAARAKRGGTPYQVRARGSLHSFPHELVGVPVVPNAGATATWLNACCCHCFATCCKCCADCGRTCTVEDPLQSPTSDDVACLLLDQIRTVSWVDNDVSKGLVDVGAGCNLNFDPLDPSGTSTLQNGLNYQIEQKGWALPDLGGIAQQTVGGFLSTGSAGGSLLDSLHDAVKSITFVDGRGVVRTVTSEKNPEFYAIGISFGLMGVITNVRFQCVKRFNIYGAETAGLIKDGSCFGGAAMPRFDLSWCDGPKSDTSIGVYLRKPENQFTRFLWWPQPGVERIVLWRAEKKVEPAMADGDRKPYVEVGDTMRMASFVQSLGGLLLTAAECLESCDTPASRGILNDLYVPALNKVFVENKTNEKGAFKDWWYTGVPMDDQIDSTLMPVVFTEIWFPMKYAEEVLVEFNKLFKAKGWSATGAFSFEMYGARASKFWLSPSYVENLKYTSDSKDGQAGTDPSTDFFRFDVFWLAKESHTFVTQPQKFYRQFWEVMDQVTATGKFPYRLHWGKYQHTNPKAQGKILASYPRMADFKALRKQLDPHDLFLSPYWQDTLQLNAYDK